MQKRNLKNSIGKYVLKRFKQKFAKTELVARRVNPWNFRVRFRVLIDGIKTCHLYRMIGNVPSRKELCSELSNSHGKYFLHFFKKLATKFVKMWSQGFSFCGNGSQAKTRKAILNP